MLQKTNKCKNQIIQNKLKYLNFLKILGDIIIFTVQQQFL